MCFEICFPTFSGTGHLNVAKKLILNVMVYKKNGFLDVEFRSVNQKKDTRKTAFESTLDRIEHLNIVKSIKNNFQITTVLFPNSLQICLGKVYIFTVSSKFLSEMSKFTSSLWKIIFSNEGRHEILF